MKNLQIISPDKTRIFYSPMYPNLVRTGTIGDGSCFFHTLCYSLFGSYRKMNIQKRLQYIQKLRHDLAESITLDRLKLLGNGEIFRMQLITAFRLFCSRLGNVSKYDFNYWDNTVLSELANKWKSTDLQDCMRLIVPLTELDNPSMTYKLLQQSENHAYNVFKQHIRTSWADEFFMELASEYFKCNFYFINATNRMVYRMFDSKNIYNKNIVFCWVEETHYECIGELLEGNHVKRVFTNTDDLILQLQKYN